MRPKLTRLHFFCYTHGQKFISNIDGNTQIALGSRTFVEIIWLHSIVMAFSGPDKNRRD